MKMRCHADARGRRGSISGRAVAVDAGIITSKHDHVGPEPARSARAALAEPASRTWYPPSLEDLAADHPIDASSSTISTRGASRGGGFDEAQARARGTSRLDRELEEIVGAGASMSDGGRCRRRHHRGLGGIRIVLEDREQGQRIGHGAGETRARDARRARSIARCRRRWRRARARSSDISRP